MNYHDIKSSIKVYFKREVEMTSKETLGMNENVKMSDVNQMTC